jgi:hypothetical protein
LRDALRKQGWQTLEDAFYEVNDFYLHNQHSGGIKIMKLFEKARNARNHPLHLRLPIEKETGWTFHPTYPNMMKKTRPLKW